jgi:DNA-binding response OmpR family regulator
MHVLLVEDEQRVSAFIKKGFEEQNIKVTQAFDGEKGLELALNNSYDVIILDVVMPKLNGLEVCKTLKQQYKLQTPIIMLTALGTTDDVVTGLDLGADDYLVKPFKFKELFARVKALNRRNQSSSISEQNKIFINDIILNKSSKEVYRKQQLIKLTQKEFKLLEFLLENVNKVVSRIDILENVWDVNFDMGTNVVDVYINYLRKKIEKPFNDKIIEAVTGVGYMIKDKHEN